MLKKIEISHRTIIFVVVFLIFLWFLYFIRDIIISLFVALLIMTILNPLVTKLSKWRIPRAISVLVSYILVLGLFGVVIAGIVPPLVEQTTNFANNLPAYFQNLGLGGLNDQQLWNTFLVQLGTLPGQAVKVGFSVFSNLVSVISVLIFAFYFLLYRSKLDEQLGFIFGEDKRAKAGKVIDEIEIKLGGWARGEMFLMLSIGISTYLGLSVLGIPFSLPLAILAGVLEIVPILGPIVAAIPAVMIGITISPLMALAVVALAFLIQQLENYVLVPKIMEKSVGVNPIITLISLTVGFRLLGIIGVLISIPLFLTIQILAKEYFRGR